MKNEGRPHPRGRPFDLRLPIFVLPSPSLVGGGHGGGGVGHVEACAGGSVQGEIGDDAPAEVVVFGQGAKRADEDGQAQAHPVTREDQFADFAWGVGGQLPPLARRLSQRLQIIPQRGELRVARGLQRLEHQPRQRLPAYLRAIGDMRADACRQVEQLQQVRPAVEGNTRQDVVHLAELADELAKS